MLSSNLPFESILNTKVTVVSIYFAMLTLMLPEFETDTDIVAECELSDAMTFVVPSVLDLIVITLFTRTAVATSGLFDMTEVAFILLESGGNRHLESGRINQF